MPARPRRREAESRRSSPPPNPRLLIDGYNVIAPVAGPGRTPDPEWLQRERQRLLDRLARHLDESVRRQTCVVFDAANPPADRPHRSEVDGIDVIYAVGYPEADDLLEELIAAHTAPKQLAVVSSDRRVAAAAKRRGATPLEAQPWLDDLMAGRPRLAARGRGGESASTAASHEQATKPHRQVLPDEVDEWMDLFGIQGPDDHPDA